MINHVKLTGRLKIKSNIQDRDTLLSIINPTPEGTIINLDECGVAYK